MTTPDCQTPETTTQLPLVFSIKDISNLQRALEAVGLEADSERRVILKQEDGKTNVEISVPISEIFKTASAQKGGESVNSTVKGTVVTAATAQVWKLTHFFCFPFVKKINDQ